jgi:hypothetical protein
MPTGAYSSAFASPAFLVYYSGFYANMPVSYARSGLAEAGLARSGYFVPNPVILIDDVDRTTAIQPASVRITLTINDEPDTAEFVIVSPSGLVPTPGESVKIALGSSENLIYGGNILTSQHVFEPDGQQTPWISVQCIDWSRQFNRRLVTHDFSGSTVSAAWLYVIETYTSGFSTARVDTTQSTVLENFVAINEAPMTVLRRIANYVQGGCKIAPDKAVACWGANGESNVYTQVPETLTGAMWSLWDFLHAYDTSQWRTRVIVEGTSAKSLLTIPVGTALSTYGMPMYDGFNLFNQGASTPDNYLRVGPMVAGTSGHPMPSSRLMPIQGIPPSRWWTTDLLTSYLVRHSG